MALKSPSYTGSIETYPFAPVPATTATQPILNASGLDGQYTAKPSVLIANAFTRVVAVVAWLYSLILAAFVLSHVNIIETTPQGTADTTVVATANSALTSFLLAILITPLP